MNREKKQMLRVVLAVRERYVDRVAPPVLPPMAEWEDLCSRATRVEKAQAHGLRLAAVKLKEESVFSLQRLSDRIVTMLAVDEDTRSTQAPPSASDIYQDLMALREEFADVTWNLSDETLSVTTEPIVLQGVYLGAFRIELRWGELPACSAYSIIAVDPNPAASNESVTHPHVEDGELCAGEGRTAIRHALAEGRLADFFLVVANILRTYNHDSAFVTLELWEGRPCMDCGTHTTEDEYVSCTQCDRSVCNDCYVYCENCHSTYCSECSSQCAGCRERYCNDCLHTCPACQEMVCSNCLMKRECECCHEEETKGESPQSDAANPSGSASAAVQPDSLGQTAVLA